MKDENGIVLLDEMYVATAEEIEAFNMSMELKHRESAAVQMEYTTQDWDEMYGGLIGWDEWCELNSKRGTESNRKEVTRQDVAEYRAYELSHDTVFIREISELVVGDAFDRFTREELLQHLGNLLNEREELIEAYVRSKTMLDITVDNIVNDFNNNFKSEESITKEEE